MIPTLATPRLLLRPLDLDDAAAIQALFPRWEIVRHMASHVPWPYPPDGALTFIRDVALPAMRDGSEWQWTIRSCELPGTLVGVVSLMDKVGDNRGCWLDPAWQGRGLMTEAIERVTDYWFETLGRSVLRVPKASENFPSRRLSERTGMRLVERTERDYVSGRMAADIWEITRDEWRRRGGGESTP